MFSTELHSRQPSSGQPALNQNRAPSLIRALHVSAPVHAPVASMQPAVVDGFRQLRALSYSRPWTAAQPLLQNVAVPGQRGGAHEPAGTFHFGHPRSSIERVHPTGLASHTFEQVPSGRVPTTTQPQLGASSSQHPGVTMVSVTGASGLVSTSCLESTDASSPGPRST